MATGENREPVDALKAMATRHGSLAIFWTPDALLLLKTSEASIEFQQIASDMWAHTSNPSSPDQGAFVMRRDTTWVMTLPSGNELTYTGHSECIVPLGLSWKHAGDDTQFELSPGTLFDDSDDCITGVSWKSSIGAFNTYLGGTKVRRQYIVLAMSVNCC